MPVTGLAETDPRVALRSAFEIIRSEIEAFRDGDEAAPPVAEAPRPVPLQAVTPAPAPVAAAPVAMSEEVATSEVETAFNES